MQIEIRMWTTSLFVSLFALPLALCQSGSPSDVRLPPTITTGPERGHYMYYKENNKFTLECKAHGVPTVTYEWKRNKVVLNLNGDNVNAIDGTITIDNAKSKDAGFYQCIAKNRFGTALSNTAFVQMAVLSSQGSTDVLPKTATEGKPFCIQAQPTKSIPKAKPTWKKAVSNVDRDPTTITLTKRIQISENGDLCFAFAKMEDNLGGKIYKLNVFNQIMDFETGGSYTNVTVDPVTGGLKQFAPDEVVFSSQNLTVAVEGRNVTLSCYFSGNPEPTLEWSGPPGALSPSRTITNADNTIMSIINVLPSDDGEYICSARNGMGSSQLKMRIRVEAEPRFLKRDDQPHDKNVTEGETLTFNCLTYAKPDATVVWLRNGEPLDLNQLPRRYRISKDHKSLTIADVCRDCKDRSESGQSDLTIIQCNASNIHGYAFGAGYVNVLLKTTVVVTGDKDVVVDMVEEKEFTWDCKVTSDPSTPTKVKWFKETKDGDEQVYEDSNEPKALFLRDGTLKIHVVPNKTQGWEKYHGKYRCDGETVYSRESVNVTLTINDYIPPDKGGIGWWWLILLIVLLLLLILLVCIICICLRRNKGDIYNVDERERKNGHDPDKELLNNGFQDYQRPSDGQNLKGSRGSLESLGKLHSDDDASLMGFGEDPGKFTEDGSFVGAYASNTANRNQVRI